MVMYALPSVSESRQLSCRVDRKDALPYEVYFEGSWQPKPITFSRRAGKALRVLFQSFGPVWIAEELLACDPRS